MKLNELPLEIFHEIFEYLDYVRDLCSHRKLLVPVINILDWSVEEFESLVASDDFIDFDEDFHSPLFLTCKLFLNAFRTFKPLSMCFRQNAGSLQKNSFQIDSTYYHYKIKTRPWFYQYPNFISYTSQSMESTRLVTEFIKQLRMFCNGAVFDRMEHLSIHLGCGKNYWCNYYYRVQLEILKYFKSLKYLNVDCSLSNESVRPTNITALTCCRVESYATEIIKNDNTYSMYYNYLIK